MDGGGESLWSRARAGEARAREELAALALAAARRELAARRAPPGIVEDLAQDAVRQTLAFLADGGEEPRELRAFLKWRAFGVLSDWRKKERRRTMHLPAAEAPADPAAEPERALPADLAAALEDCRARLAETDRSVLALRYEGALDAAELAERLATTRNAIHVRVFRALARLRDCLEKKGWRAEDVQA